jgi:hydrogenase maturation protein HypF
MMEALDIQVTGIVQGVGFRPFIYRLAKRYLINGWVLNAADGVSIHAEAEGDLVDRFVLEISENPPAASKVEQIEMKEVPLQGFDSFEIRFSDESEAEKTTLVSPDLGTCDDCVRELFDPADRRYRYPFINCTNCGPRFTIIRDLPYDRRKTSMASFGMCPVCAAEYADPENRRFHAQPDACFDCGPHISWYVSEDDSDRATPPSDPHADPRVQWGMDRDRSDAIIAHAVSMLRQGRILAVKGLGGFHLVCDASNADALSELRRRKRREGKAFAVMAPGIAALQPFCFIGEEEERILKSVQRPIVLLKKKPEVHLAIGLADGLPELGAMLPATPLQHLLLHDFQGLLVMTSGNVHDEPIQTDDVQAYRALAGIADAFLGNDRPILSRYDDSVLRLVSAGPADTAIQMIRRARGYAPLPIRLPDSEGSPCIFATGPEQKNTFCLSRPGEAFVSQHIGDMENVMTNDAWLEAKDVYRHLFRIEPAVVACDKHPEYLTGKWAHSQNLPVVEVQHHHAHIASAMAENGLTGPVCGVAFDGTGYGEDGALWGGEVLLANVQTFERFANFAYFPLPGGAAAINHPLRCAYGALWAFDLLGHPAAASMLADMGDSADVCGQMIDRSLNCPQTSSVGRLFDAASAILGLCREPRYEGEGAVLLEAAIDMRPSSAASHADGAGDAYSIDVVKNTAGAGSTALETSVVLMDAAPLFRGLLDDKQAGVPAGIIARRFHDAFVAAIVQQAQLVEALYDIRTVVLSGGVFMNRYLLEHVLSALAEAGFAVAVNRELPPNDACISFGQTVVALQAKNNGAE